ncbi:MAG: polyphosphate kinase 1 [Gammaproteobacteria bacterium]|nr:polyphosphate kinase 1 [Gammaproteobacteria bacterium]
MTNTNTLNLYLHPELSLLAFNERVLNMALDPLTPLLERLKFLCIFSSNLDEYFEIRVSGLKAKAESNLSSEGIDGLTPALALEKISDKSHELVDLQYEILNNMLIPDMKKHGIDFLPIDQWSAEQAKWLKQYFKREVLPILTPIRLDPAHPFPLTINKGLGIVVDLHDPERDDAHNIAVVPAPRVLPRFIRLPEELGENEYEYVYLSAIIHAHIKLLFTNVEVLGCYQFRITRNSDLYVDLEEVEDLARALEGELPSRLFGEAIRLEVSRNCPKRIIKFLSSQFQLDKNFIYQVNGPVNLNRLFSLPDLVNRPQIKYSNFTPAIPEYLSAQANLFDVIHNGDVLLYHPFQSFAPVVELLRQAASDPEVLVIKQSLYRTGSDSIIIQHLSDAARAGKEVTVVIELMARFDEQNNLATAQRLQEAGAHVVYGMVGRKTHAKMMMILRREGKKLRRYVHIGTGNYHQGNTRIYTDYGLMSCEKAITQDVHELFMQLTTQGPNPELQKMFQSPFGINNMLIDRITRETENARAGKPAAIIIKVNGLSSQNIIDALYQASQAGVQIDLVVRGICCLRPGLEGVSDNIRVRSIVGRFLEHTRVFYFANSDAEPEVFISSADLMPRNLLNRIEQCAPIEDESLKSSIIIDLECYLNDTSNAWIMLPDGTYKPSIDTPTEADQDTESVPAYNAQHALLQRFADQTPLHRVDKPA